MKKFKSFSKKILGTIVASSLVAAPMFLTTSCSCSIQDNTWKNAIEYMADCKHPTIHFTFPSSIEIQESVDLYLASSLLAQSRGHTYKNEEYKYNDNIMLVQFDGYHYKTDECPVENFNYKYRTLIDSKFGFKDIIQDGVDKANNMVVTNLQDFNTDLTQYDESASDYGEYASFCRIKQDEKWNFAIDEKIFDKIVSLYPEGTKFNFVMCAPDFMRISSRAAIIPEACDLLTKMMRCADKIYLLSEGWSIFVNIEYYRDVYKSSWFKSHNDKKKLWDIIHNSSYQEARDYVYHNNMWLEFSNDTEFVQYFTQANDVLQTKHFQKPEDGLTASTMIHPGYNWLTVESYKQVLPDDDTYTQFQNSFLSFYLFYESGMHQKFDDYIINTGGLTNNFDPKKKNMIFLLPSFMGRRTELSEDEKYVLNDFKKSIDKIAVNYPADKWNYIFKFHPRATTEASIVSLKAIFNDQLPTNMVVLQHKYPSEVLFVIDDYLFKTGKESCYHLIDPRTLNDDKPSGIITSENLISTATYTAMELIARENSNISWEQTKKLIQTDAFFVPKKHVLGTLTKGDDCEARNRVMLKDFFDPFTEINHFIDVSEFKTVE